VKLDAVCAYNRKVNWCDNLSKTLVQ